MAEKSKKQSGGSKGVMVSVLGTFIVLVVLAPGSAIVAVVGVIPTLVYWIVDAHIYRSLRLRTIFLFNAAAVLPFMVLASESLQSGVELLVAGQAPMIAMAGAGLGLGLLKIVPGISSFFANMVQVERARKIGNQQKTLVDVWGPDIVSESSDYFKTVGDAPKKSA
jgi:hypothetical protein